MKDLNFVSTDDLIDELTSRFDFCVFMGRKDKGDAENTRIFRRRYEGDPHTCIGMTQDLSDYILGKIDESEEELSSEDS